MAILRLAVLVQCWLLTDGQTDGQTDIGRAFSSGFFVQAAIVKIATDSVSRGPSAIHEHLVSFVILTSCRCK